MKVSFAQLGMAVARIKSTVHGYSKNSDDLVIDIDFIQADPGKGIIADALILSASAPVDGDKEDKETKMTIELYPANDKEEPRGTITTVLKVRNPY